MVLLFYTTYISVDLAHHKIFCAKVGQGGINDIIKSDVAFYLQPIVHFFFKISFYILGFIKHCLHALNNGILIGWRQRYAG